MRLLLLALAACAGEPSAPPAPTPRDATVDPLVGGSSYLAPAAPVAPVVPRAKPAVVRVPVSPERSATEAIPAIHGATIEALAVTEDGGTAATVDTLGATRLWPSLDGRLEPVVVAASRPTQLALARDGERILLATLDRAGSLEFLTLRPTGAIAWRAPIAEDRPFVAIAALHDGFIGTTDDQRIAVFTADGVPDGHLIPEPGEHLVGLAHRGTAALALVAVGAAVHGRWITSAGWGAATPRLPIDPSHAQLSQDRERIVAARPDHKGIVVVALDTGRVVERIATQDNEDPNLFPLGYIAAHQLAIAANSQVAFPHDAVLGTVDATGDDRERLAPIVAVDGMVVWGRRASLELVTPTATKTLGFKLAVPTELRAIEHGFMVSDGMELVRVDDRFAERERYPMPPDLWSLIPLDAHHALTSVRTATGDIDVTALDLDDPDAAKLLLHGGAAPVIYQPATHLLAIVMQAHVMIGRYEPRTGTFADLIAIPIVDATTQIALPEHGAPVIVVERLTKISAVRITPITALDFAGHTYTAGAVRTTLIPGDFERTGLEQLGLAPPIRAARGKLVATLADGRITLRDGDAPRWVVPSHGIAQLAWSARGDLVGMGTGLVHLDLATGALAGPHCGWSFGLWLDPPAFPGSTETLCDARN